MCWSIFLIRSIHWRCSIKQKQLPDMFYKKSCSQQFCNIHRKIPVLQSLFNKAKVLKAYNFIKKRHQHRFFPVNIAKYLRKTFFTEHLQRLRLIFIWMIVILQCVRVLKSPVEQYMVRREAMGRETHRVLNKYFATSYINDLL